MLARSGFAGIRMISIPGGLQACCLACRRTGIIHLGGTPSGDTLKTTAAETDVDDVRAHWDDVYRSKRETGVSWFQEKPRHSIELIRNTTPDATSPVIDVGGGASRLADEFLRFGYTDVTVLDVSGSALERSKARLGAAADRAEWIVADVTKWKPLRKWRIWHDRAVFHFLTDAASQDAYLTALEQATEPGAAVIIATFALDGPERCSGLPVQRYSPETLTARLGTSFRLVDLRTESHVTPKGIQQNFQYAKLRRC